MLHLHNLINFFEFKRASAFSTTKLIESRKTSGIIGNLVHEADYLDVILEPLSHNNIAGNHLKNCNHKWKKL